MDGSEGSPSNIYKSAATRLRREEINKLKKLGRSLKSPDPGNSPAQFEMCRGCLVLIDGITNHEYCDSLQSYQNKEKELRESRKRKKMMEDILKDHYEPDNDNKETSPPVTSPSDRSGPPKAKKMKCMKCEFFTFSLESFLTHQSGGHEDIVTSNVREYFHIPEFSGFYCLLQGSRSKERYYVTEVPH